ncbi:MAG: shikimate dehydrogenase [Candidatus Coatesbacteria bacterium]
MTRRRTVTRVAVFGDPVAHSLSPAMHNAAFRATGLAWRYDKLRVPRSRLRAALRRARRKGWRGVNLTIPLKEAALPLMDRLTPEARRAGAVNTVTFEDGRMEGHSTDGEGFLRALRDAWGFRPLGGRVIVLGAGGAARSVSVALAAAGARSIVIVNRHPARARVLSRALTRAVARTAVRAVAWPAPEAWGRMLRCADLLVNATSVGLHGGPSPVPAGAIPRRLRVADLVYNPACTALVREARARGVPAVNGAGMLVHQGALAFERWTGRCAPVRIMHRALAAALARNCRSVRASQNRCQPLAQTSGLGYRKKLKGMHAV